MKIHELKTIQPYYSEIMYGLKKFDVRKNDRTFQVGDRLLLHEYDDVADKYTGCSIKAIIIYILHGGQFGIEQGYVILGIEEDTSKYVEHNIYSKF